MVTTRWITAAPLVIAALALMVGCQSEQVQSSWSMENVLIDGQRTDWIGIPTTYLKDSAVQLGLCNDDDNLYILLRFTDEKKAFVMRRNGLSIWIDKTGRKQKKFGIRYYGGPPLSEMRRWGPTGSRMPLDSVTTERQRRFRDRQLPPADQIEVIIDGGEQAVSLSDDGSGGPLASFHGAKGIYTYEFSIPLKTNDDDMFVIDAQPGQTINVGFEWGTSPRDLRDRMRERDDRGGMDDRDGGRAPGGRRGGPPRGFGGGMGGQQEIWMEVSLASPPKE